MKKEISHVLQVVGHVPRQVLSVCSIFIRQGGIIKYTVLDVGVIPLTYHKVALKCLAS